MQIVVKDKNDFDIISKHAGVQYASPITGVIEIMLDVSDPLYVKVKKYAEQLEATATPKKQEIITPIDISNKWEVTFTKGIYILSENTNLAEYLDSYVSKEGKRIKVPFEYMWKFALLLRAGFFVPTRDFIDMFPPMTEKSKINECRNWSSKVNYRNVKWSFEEFYQKAGLAKPDIEISSCKFLNEDLHMRNYVLVKGYVIDISSDAKKIQFKNSETNEICLLEMRGWQRFRRPNYPEGKEITIATSTTGTNIINPFIVPEFLNIKTADDLNKFENSFGYISNRRMPVELANRLKAEVMIRLYLGMSDDQKKALARK